MAVITLLTVQNTRGVRGIYVLKPSQVARQINAVIGDIPPQAVKTGALGNQEVIRAVAACVKNSNARLWWTL